MIAEWPRPQRVVVTAGMPYANGPLHLGHLAGAQIPADIHARWMKLLVGEDNVLFVCGTDDHGSATELSATRAGVTVREQIDRVHAQQAQTMERYHVGLDVYSGTSQPDAFAIQCELVDWWIRRLNDNGMLHKRTSLQWYDPELHRFLQDRFVSGTCPNCGHGGAFSDACDNCGAQYQPDALANPKSTLSDATPELRETVHWWLDLWEVADELAAWIRTKKKIWRKLVYNEVYNTVLPTLTFSNEHEAAYKAIKAELPAHKSRYAPGKRVAVVCESKAALRAARERLEAEGIETQLDDGWAHRSITRDVGWGVPLPADLDPDMAGKTLYVWPDSLIAPIAFTRVALGRRGALDDAWRSYWQDPAAEVVQFLGEDNVYFYVLMQGAMWLGTQSDPHRMPRPGEYQMTEVVGCHHLLVNGEKMSKSAGNFYTASSCWARWVTPPTRSGTSWPRWDWPIASRTSGSKRWTSATGSWPGRSTRRSKSRSRRATPSSTEWCPHGELDAKVAEQTYRIVTTYLRSMDKISYVALLGDVENYAPPDQQPVRSVQAARRSASGQGTGRCAVLVLLRAQESDGDAAAVRARHHGAASRLPESARRRVSRGVAGYRHRGRTPDRRAGRVLPAGPRGGRARCGGEPLTTIAGENAITARRACPTGTDSTPPCSRAAPAFRHAWLPRRSRPGSGRARVPARLRRTPRRRRPGR